MKDQINEMLEKNGVLMALIAVLTLVVVIVVLGVASGHLTKFNKVAANVNAAANGNATTAARRRAEAFRRRRNAFGNVDGASINKPKSGPRGASFSQSTTALVSYEHTQPSLGNPTNASSTYAVVNNPAERLVNNRGEPDFWEISDVLGEHRYGVGQDAQNKKNYWSPDMGALLSAREVAAITDPSVRANVKFVPQMSQQELNNAGLNGGSERFRVLPTVGNKGRRANCPNKALCPEDHMMMENFALGSTAPETKLLRGM